MTEEKQEEKKLCRNPSGIPPLPSDSEDESDEGDLNASTVLSTLVEGVADEPSRDPPTIEKAPSDTLNDGGDVDTEINDSGEAAVDDHGPQAAPQEQTESASTPTTDAQSPRGAEAPLTTPRGVTHHPDDGLFSSQNDSSTRPVSQEQDPGKEQSSSQQERMPPNIIKAALQEEVMQHDEAPEMVPEAQETTQDEKKSEERSDSELMPPPEHDSQVHSISLPPPRSVMVETSSSVTHAHSMPYPEQQAYHPMQQQMAMPPYGYTMAPSPYTVAHAPPPVGGRRKIVLRLEQDVPSPSHHTRRPSFFFRHRRDDSILSTDSIDGGVDRGSIAVSWFEGTTSAELQEHVRTSLIRKMGLGNNNVKLVDLRIIDESMDPPEEIVLSPFIPDGSRFLLRFSTKEKQVLDSSTNFASRYLNNQIASTAPVSPSAAPSPHHSASNLLNLNEEQLTELGAKLKGLEGEPKRELPTSGVPDSFSLDEDVPLKKVSRSGEEGSRGSDLNEEEVMMMDPDDQIEARMRQLTDLLVNERRGKRIKGDSYYRRQEKKQVIFVMANYFVLFLSLIAIMAEIQSRAPRWLEWAESNLESVQSCATDQESLFKCVSNGDFSGLIASFILWFGRSAATRRFFLFGFETPKRLWTVVYEAMVTAFCWGISYMFIRRGMNPDTRQNFLSKYWKDAVYGSLAGFNASFLKAVLKNLVPQEALEDALQERHLKILSFLPSFH